MIAAIPLGVWITLGSLALMALPERMLWPALKALGWAGFTAALLALTSAINAI